MNNFEEYDHSAVDHTDLILTSKVERIYSFGKRFFQCHGDKLEGALIEFASNVLKKDVVSIHNLHWRDGGEVLKQLEEKLIGQ